MLLISLDSKPPESKKAFPVRIMQKHIAQSKCMTRTSKRTDRTKKFKTDARKDMADMLKTTTYKADKAKWDRFKKKAAAQRRK